MEQTLARKLREDEIRLISRLQNAALGRSAVVERLDELLVRDQDDGGMGSVIVRRGGLPTRFGAKISELTFVDEDGVSVSASLNVDTEGRIYELDIFKSDFSARGQIPKEI